MREQIFEDHESDVPEPCFLSKIEIYDHEFSYSQEWIHKLARNYVGQFIIALIIASLFISFGVLIFIGVINTDNAIKYVVAFGISLVICFIPAIILYFQNLGIKNKLSVINAALYDIYGLERKSLFLGLFGTVVQDDILYTAVGIEKTVLFFKIARLLIIGINCELYDKGYRDIEEKGKHIINSLYVSLILGSIVTATFLITTLIVLNYPSGQYYSFSFFSLTFASIVLFATLPNIFYMQYLFSASKMLKDDTKGM